MLQRHLPIHPLRAPHDFEQALDDERQPQWLHEIPFSEAVYEFGVERDETLTQSVKQSLAALMEAEVVEFEVAFFGRDAFAYDVEEIQEAGGFLCVIALDNLWRKAGLSGPR